MSKWLIYDSSGIFTGTSIDCPTEFLDQNVPEGCGCIMGTFDALSQRVDMATGAVVDHQPAAPSSEHQWDAGTKRWVYVMPLDKLQAVAISKTFADVDAVIWDAVGNRTVEYQLAEAAARAFKAGGYVGDVDEDVSEYALHNRTGQAQTNRWAADEIIARADAFRAAQKSMRKARFTRQGDMQASTTPAGLAATVAAWDGFIAQLRAQLGLPGVQ